MSSVMNAPVPTRIDRYEIEGLIGEGGMGRVYRARDTQLGRAVAIKLLSPIFAVDPERLRRFEQEARATAALNHPGVLAIYDVGTFDGTPYLVSELLEGSSLAERLKAERLSVRRSTEFGLQIAEALTAAHERGIVHRDLKPDNVFITPQDRIKILDFGLAKLTAPELSLGSPDATVAAATIANTILGTPGYMSPEQARGQAADHRSDIFSFGCVLYEMLKGHQAFGGETATDVLSAILKEAPPPLTTSVERPLAPALDAIVQRCLAKDPASRFQSASDLSFALRTVLTGSDVRVSAVGAASVPAQPARRRLLTMAAALLITAAIGAVVGWLLHGSPQSTTADSVTEFLVPTPTSAHSFASQPLPGLLPTAPQVGISPDGNLLAFVSTDPAGLRRLWLRAVDNIRPRALEGTDDATSWPFWSPDSRFVVFAAKRALIKVDVRSGTTERICTLPDQAPAVPFVTGAWSLGGTILFSIGGLEQGLYRVAASGGRPEPATTIDKRRGDNYHSWPQFLSDDRFLLFVRTSDPKTNGVYAGSLSSPEMTLVMPNATRAVVAAGHLLWSFENRLVAQPFDASRLKLTGASATLVSAIYEGAGRTPGYWASDGGVVVYASGDTRERQFHSYARNGQSEGTVGPPGFYGTFDASADLSHVVAEVTREGTSFTTLAIVDAARGALTPLTLGDQHDTDPRFGPNEDIVFARNTRSGPGIMRISAARPTPATIFPRGNLPVIWLEDWAADGSGVVFRSGANRDAWLLGAASSEPVKLTDAREAIEQVQLSPDRGLIAYSTAESGRQEIFVAPVPFTGERWQISTAGGVQPTWRADGRELYFLSLDGGLYAVSIGRERGAMQAGRPELLFSPPLPVISTVVEQYRPSGDGQRFLFCLPLTPVAHEPLRMLINWPERLRRVAADR
jgi:serine/threonine protein kinase